MASNPPPFFFFFKKIVDNKTSQLKMLSPFLSSIPNACIVTSEAVTLARSYFCLLTVLFNFEGILLGYATFA